MLIYYFLFLHLWNLCIKKVLDFTFSLPNSTHYRDFHIWNLYKLCNFFSFGLHIFRMNNSYKCCVTIRAIILLHAYGSKHELTAKSRRQLINMRLKRFTTLITCCLIWRPKITGTTRRSEHPSSNYQRANFKH